MRPDDANGRTRIRRIHAVGIVFLLLQAGSILYARFTDERFFCWAPYDQHTRYRIEVEIDGGALDPESIQDRYRYRAEAWEPRNIANVFSIVKQYETSYGQSDSAKVRIFYRKNGMPQRIWEWPQ
jgi:hypothetical protein